MELHDLYSSPNIVRVIKSRRMGWTGNVARMGDRKSVYRFLVERHEGKRHLRRPSRRCGGNIKMNFKEFGWGGIDYSDLAECRDRWRALVNAVMNFRVP